MEWGKLLSKKRLSELKHDYKPQRPQDRTEFERDFDRIVFSNPCRRLQGKTQVVPLPGSDLIHNRLFHSFETACVGRSLGKIVGSKILQRGGDCFSPEDFADIVGAACLAHDIGNPPFGHSGEDAIAGYFTDRIKEIANVSNKQLADFQNFNGNALGFRILTNNSNSQSEWEIGLDLTLATLGAFTKYPF